MDNSEEQKGNTPPQPPAQLPQEDSQDDGPIQDEQAMLAQQQAPGYQGEVPGTEDGGLFSQGQAMNQPGHQYAQNYDPMEGQGYSPGQQYLPPEYQDQYQQEMKEKEGDNALVRGQLTQSLEWVLGFNKDIQQGVHNLTDETRRVSGSSYTQELFYSAAHTGVIYDYAEKTQKLLQGHCNLITATACSRDKKWIVTGDTGRDSMLVVWDSQSGTPVKTIFDPHPHGVRAVDISPDSQYIVTLSNIEREEGADENQESAMGAGLGNKGRQFMSLWDWMSGEREGPLVSSMVDPACDDLQTCAIFNPQNIQEIATNGMKRVFFWSWDPNEPTFQYYAPPFRPQDLKSQIGNFTQTVFIPTSQQVVTGTDDGNIVVWDISLIVDDNSEPEDRRAIKAVQLNNNVAINVLCLQDDMLVTGNQDGTVRFYDFQFRIKAWFENLDTKEILSISFANEPPKPSTKFEELGTAATDEVFECPDFIIADRSSLVCLLESSLFEEIDPSKSKGEVIMRGIYSSINCIAVHPNQPILAIGGKSGFVQTWNYLTKSTIVNRFDIFDKEIPTAMDMSPDGKYLVVGFHNGNIRFLDPLQVKDKQEGPLKVSDTKTPAIRYITVAPDSNYLATIDNFDCVSLFKIGYRHNDENFPREWVFAGKMRAHRRKVTSIAFGESLDQNMKPYLRLFSVGMDRYLFEYSVYNSNQMKLKVESSMRIEQEAYPTACVWYPQIDSRQDLLVTANDEYKMKIWNVITKSSRKTCLGPTYGDAISSLRILKVGPRVEDKYVIYSTKKKVVGMMKLPLDGNPHKTMGLIAHPDDVIDIRGTTDGKYLFTCGGSDLSINMWSVNVQPIEQAIAMGGQDVEPFISLIEGGSDGQTFQDMKDFFYYSQIRSKKENTTKTRKLDGTVPLSELPFLMRAMGYYPSEMEIENMKNEVKYSRYTQMGQGVSSVDIATFIKLFVNHRPVYGIGKSKIEQAFIDLIGKGQPPLLRREELVQALTREGECIGIEELGNDCLKHLVGESNIMEALPEEISAEVFCEQVLGFQEIDDIDEGGEGEDELMGNSEMQPGYEGEKGQPGNSGIIPEEAEVEDTRGY